MDVLSEVLRGMRITGALLFNSELTAPWGYAAPPVASVQHLLAPGTEHLVVFHLVTEGRAMARAGGHEVGLEAGDIVVLPHGDAHVLSSGPVRHPVDATTLLPKILTGSLALERGGGGGSATRFVCGYFGCERYAGRLFLAGLPPVFKVNVRGDEAGAWIEASLRHLVDEVGSARPGRLALISKLSEALFVETLCRYADEQPPEVTGWLAAARDPVVGRALALLHHDPARAWTLPRLAREAGASRSVLVARFTRLLALPPLAYLARWRLQLAARLLETTDRSALQVAAEVGYGSEAAFNRAFKREFDLPPARYRRRLASAPEERAPATVPAGARVRVADGRPARPASSHQA